MNKLSERITSILGSSVVIGLFAAWLIYHTITQKDYLSFISELAILIGLLILRSETVMGERQERYIKEAKKDVKEDLAKSNEVISLLMKRGKI